MFKSKFNSENNGMDNCDLEGKKQRIRGSLDFYADSRKESEDKVTKITREIQSYELELENLRNRIRVICLDIQEKKREMSTYLEEIEISQRKTTEEILKIAKEIEISQRKTTDEMLNVPKEPNSNLRSKRA